MQEPIIPLEGLDDFQKLLFAQREIKELKEKLSKKEIELGIVTSERDEVIHLLKDPKLGLHKYLTLKEQSRNKDKSIQKLRRDNQELICKIARNENNSYKR